MAFTANADRCYRIPKQWRRITNWVEYDLASRQRVRLTIWFTEAAIAAWWAQPRTTSGRQLRYLSLAIATMPWCRTVTDSLPWITKPSRPGTD
jgi:hypothetical protein